jgi:hypothetical protein
MKPYKKGTWYARNRKHALKTVKKYDQTHPDHYSHKVYLIQKENRAVSQMNWYWKNHKHALTTMKKYRDRKRREKNK